MDERQDHDGDLLGLAANRRLIPAFGFLLLAASAVLVQGRGVPRPVAGDSAIADLWLEAQPVCRAVFFHPRLALSAQHCVEGVDGPEQVSLAVGDAVIPVVEIRRLRPLGRTLTDLDGADLVLFVTLRPEPTLPFALGSPDGADSLRVPLRDGPADLRVLSIGDRSLVTVGGTCGGDSGAPALDSEGRLVGVASWRTPGECGRGVSVFTRLDSHRTWLLKTVGEMKEHPP